MINKPTETEVAARYALAQAAAGGDNSVSIAGIRAIMGMFEGQAYDSRPDTYSHAFRVGELIGQQVKQLLDRMTQHDRSKTEEPEVSVFNEYTPKLADLTYGSEEYFACLRSMAGGLEHHYANNRHHPEHTERGVAGMTLVDLVEMLCDWKAASERHKDGDIVRSLEVQRDRFGLSDQLYAILINTVVEAGW